ncbi:MAG: hypothetical protein AAF607_07555 [Pseudomonadota bacterium]
MTATHKYDDLWQRGYRPISAKIYFASEGGLSDIAPVKLQEMDLAPDFPVLRAILRNWMANGNTPIDHVEVTPREDIDREALQANSISCLLH